MQSLSLVLGCTVLGQAPARADGRKGISSAYSVGNVERGALAMPLYRGNVVPFELMVAATPNNCSGTMWLEMQWDKHRNTVTVALEGKKALEPFPDVDRTEGVDYFPNPFFPEPEDVVDGRYQFWVASAGGPLLTFYYSPDDLSLLGSELDFETPPENAIPAQFPTLTLFGTPMFQPKKNGDVREKWHFSYDRIVRGDLPEFAHFYVTFVPPNLCEVNPNRIDLSNLRPYVSKPAPAAEGLPFSYYLDGGMLFDLTIESPEYYTNPPSTTLIATYSGATAIAGTIPKDWALDINAVFQNVAPAIRPWEAAGTCENWYPGLHTQGLNFCQPTSQDGGQ